jgi:hypothetical protein
MGINASDFSGLADSTTYYFKVDGVEFSVETGTAPTYEDVANLVNAALYSANYTAAIVGSLGDQDIRVSNVGVRGYGGTCTLTKGTTGNDLFTNLRFWSRFRKPTVYGYYRGSDALIMSVVVGASGTQFHGSALTEGPGGLGVDSYYGDRFYNDGFYQV